LIVAGLIELAQALLLIAAILWTGGNDRMMLALSVSFVAAVAVGNALSGIDRAVAMSALDAAIVAYASRIWVSHNDMRGWWIGWLGFIKISARLGYASNPAVSHYLFAAGINAAFFAQVIIAGGMLDGLGRRIADYLRHAGPRRARLLRNVEGR
jgi:hypothetical protein